MGPIERLLSIAHFSVQSRPPTTSSKTTGPIRVKFLARGSGGRRAELWSRQFPGREPLWENCRFLFDADERNYDWLVVYDDLPPLAGERFSRRKETLACPAGHTLLVTGEPSSIKLYGRDFLAQFARVLTSQEPWAIPHPNAIFSQPGLRWYYGVGKTHVRTYDEMREHPPEAKTRVLSTVCSSKQQRHTLHHTRYNFVQQLKARLPGLDIFGHGVRFMDDKAEALDPYRYHIAIENHVCRHHWTEKLADSFLGLTLPFYHGCPNASDYFPPESYIPIDIHDVEGSATIIRRAIENGEYEKRLPHIREARRRVLERYNLFAVLSEIIAADTASPPQPHRRPRADACVVSRHRLRRENPLTAVRFAWERLRAWQLARGHSSQRR